MRLSASIPKGNQSRRQFKYELYTADILPWVNGTRSGIVKDDEGVTADGLKRFMHQAEKSLDMAVYGVQKESWFFSEVRALLKKRVGIKAVVDQDAGEVGEWKPENFTYRDTIHLQKVLSENSVVPDQSQDGQVRAGTIMHNKFLVADKKALWTGSTNISHTCLGSEYNANVSIAIHSKELAELYHAEFEQMFYNLKFSIYKEPTAIKNRIKYDDGTVVEVYFSPKDNAILEGIIPFIHEAQRTLDIGMFYLTHAGVTEALETAIQRGVKIRVIADAVAAAHPSSRVKELRLAGVEVRVENWGGKMHMKSAISDKSHVVIGSMNWTAAGDERNDENTLIVRNNPILASQLTSYFTTLWDTLKKVKTDVRAESHGSINSCVDGIDNDHDGQIDALDSGCR